MKAWIFQLTKIGKGVSQLESAITRPHLDSISSIGANKKYSVFCSACAFSCQHQKEVRRTLEAAIRKVPLFTTFLGTPKADEA